MKKKMVNNMGFKDRLKNLRQEYNLTQSELAAKLGVKKQTVSTWEIGRNLPGHGILMKICEVFDCSMDYLLCRTEIKKAIVVEDKFSLAGEEHSVKLEVNQVQYPYGLTHQQVLEILEGMDKLHMLDMFKKNNK
jgi:transcriptional regulator with XRE-family HTH domain